MAGIRKCVATSMINDYGRNDCDRKEDEVDEEFYSNILFDEQGKGHEGIP
jgi:hypothetical protein